MRVDVSDEEVRIGVDSVIVIIIFGIGVVFGIIRKCNMLVLVF